MVSAPLPETVSVAALARSAKTATPLPDPRAPPVRWTMPLPVTERAAPSFPAAQGVG